MRVSHPSSVISSRSSKRTPPIPSTPTTPGLDGDHIPGDQGVGSGQPEQGRFVHLEAYSVSEAEVEAVCQSLAGFTGPLGGVTRALDHLGGKLVESLAGDPRSGG